MIQLTATHIKILERQAQGWPEERIRRFAGLHRDSDWLGTMQIINAWKMQEAEREATCEPSAEELLGSRQAAVYRYLVDSNGPRTILEIAAHVGLSRKDTRKVCSSLRDRQLIRRHEGKKGGAKEWVAA